jgi:hypothetical protein
MLQPKVSTILPRAKNQPKAKNSTTKQKARPAHNLPEMEFPASHDLQHAMLTFTACYGCGEVVPEAGLFPKCKDCGALMCRSCECGCACDEIEIFSIPRSAHFVSLTSDDAPRDSQYTISADGCLFLWV